MSDTLPTAVVSAYDNGSSLTVLESVYGIERHRISRQLRASGIRIRQRGELLAYAVNHNAFDEWEPETEYWAGFIMADGCISIGHGQPEVRVSLSAKDVGHLEKLRSFVQSDRPISRFERISRDSGNIYPYATFIIRSSRIVEMLSRAGVVARKTQTASVVGIENSKHFWRGLSDGDGSLTFTSKCPSYQLAGTEALMTQFSNFVERHLGFRPTMGRRKKSFVFWLCQYGRKAVSLVEFMYRHQCPSLARKQEKAEVFMQHYSRCEVQ